MPEKTVAITPIDLYRFLIGELRYAYTRNNHLQPSAAYGEAKKFLPMMLEADEDVAVNTAKQLCDECISDQIAAHFYTGIDDEFGNRREAIEFVEWLMSFVHDNGGESYRPYNYDLYEDNIKRAADLKYTVMELEGFDFENGDVFKAEKEILASNLSKDEADNILFSDVLKADIGTFNRVDIKDGKYSRKVIGEKLRIIEPETHKGRIYCIILSDRLNEKKEG